MSNIIVPNEAKVNFVNAMVNDIATLSDCRIYLYQNLTSIGLETTLSELEANECTWTGYSSQALSGWTTPTFIDPYGTTTADAVNWSMGESIEEFIQGFFVKSQTGNALLFCGQFDSPIRVVEGGSLSVNVTLDADSIYSVTP